LPLENDPAESRVAFRDESRDESLEGSFFDGREDELVWERLLVVDPALPECLGGTVISPWQDAHMVREVEHAVKAKHGRGHQSRHLK
jgi:hypothetical protein